QAARADRDQAVQEAKLRAGALDAALNAELAKNLDFAGQIAAAKLEVEKAQIQVTVALGQAKAAEEKAAAGEVALLATRKSLDDVEKKYNESSVAISD